MKKESNVQNKIEVQNKQHPLSGTTSQKCQASQSLFHAIATSEISGIPG